MQAKEQKEIYKLLADGYYGINGFYDGSYLERHPREAFDKYEKRKKLAYYLNYLQACVNAHVTPIFKSKPNREWKGGASELWKTFTESVDYVGTTIDALMKRAALSAKLFGVNFIVTDNSEKQSQTVGQMLDERNYPQAFIVEPTRVKKIEKDKLGRMVLFSYYEQSLEDTTRQNVRTFTQDGWKLEEDGGKIINSNKWKLGKVPVIPLYAREVGQGEIYPPSEFISIAQTNKQIYNMCSWLTDILVNQAFSILVYPTTKPDDLVIGTSNALGFGMEAKHRPEFIAPPAAPAEILAKQIEILQKECYRMATVVNVTGVKTQASGEAKAWDFEQTNQILSSFADNIEFAEKQLAQMFSLWVNLDLEYTVNYPSDFSISDVQTELSNAEIAKSLNFGEGFDLEIFKRVLNAYLPEIKAVDFDNLIKEYSQKKDEDRQDKNHLGLEDETD